MKSNSLSALPSPRYLLKPSGEKLFTVAIAVYFFSYLPVMAAYRAAETVMILAFLWLIFVSDLKPKLKPRLYLDPLLLACFAMMAFLLLARLWYSYSLPPEINPEIRETRYFLKPILVFLVAFGIGVIKSSYRWAFLLLSLAGLAIYLLTTINSNHWSNALKGGRVDFDIHNAQHAAMFLGTALIGTLCFLPRCVRFASPRWRPALIALSILILSALAFGFTATQTRAAWLGLLMAGGIAFVTVASLIWKSKDNAYRRRGRSAIFSLALLFLVSASFLGFATSERVKTLFNNQSFTLEQYASLDDNSVDPKTSHGIRLYSWRVALEWLKDRPLLGWGPGSTADLIDESSFFSDEFKERFGHMHNSFVESLVANGLIGSAILLGIVIWMGTTTFITHHKGKMPDDAFIFACSFFGFWFTINLFESYALYTTGHYINTVIGGFIYSFYLQSESKDINL